MYEDQAAASNNIHQQFDLKFTKLDVTDPDQQRV